ncbi:MAG: helix-turn-helix domain-containing protein [Oscillospiraceae bacterium]
MFLFPGSPQEDPLGHLVKPSLKNPPSSHNFSVKHPEGPADNMRTLNVPFCINIMAGGRYSTNQMVSLTSISGKEHFHLEKNSAIEKFSLPENECIEMHQHDYFELMYVFDGEVEQHIENGCYRYTKGTACLMNRNTRHYEVLGESFFLVFLCLSKDFISGSMSAYAPAEGEQNTVYRFFASNLEEQAQYQKDYLEFVPVPPGTGGPEQVAGTMEELARELLLKQPGHTHMVLGLVSRILAYLQQPSYYRCTHVTLNSSAEAYLFSKVTRLMETKNGRVSRAELAEMLNYSSDYINRVVKKHTNMSISEYNQMISMKKAEDMLVQTEASISGIIAALGFENKTHFYKLFDRKHGITPMEYRKLHAGETT